MTSAAAISLRDASVTLGGRPVLRGVDLEVARGQCVAVMGANGSGKSTMIRAVVGLWPLAAGEVRLFGTPLADFRERYRLGYVPQRASAASGVPASVWEVVASGRLTRRRRWRPLSRADRAAIVAALDTVGMAGKEHESVATLSGGQQQRVLIARALAGEPELLILDEPTAGVDLPNQLALAETLRTLRVRGATIVAVTHELGPMQPIVDRSVVMRDGRIAYDGEPLTDQQVHSPDFGGHAAAIGLAGSHTHHHGPGAHGHDAGQPGHALNVQAPLEEPGLDDTGGRMR